MASMQVKELISAFQQGTICFDNVAITQASLADNFLPFISLESAHLPQADFRHAVLPGAQLHRAHLVKANFEHANLLGIDLSLANLNQAKLDHTLLASANLKKAILRGASLIGARLTNVDMSFADLRNANLIGANLQNTNLSNANLFGARITPNTLESAIFNNTIMPSGYCYTGPWKDYYTNPQASLATYPASSAWTNQTPEQSTPQLKGKDHPGATAKPMLPPNPALQPGLVSKPQPNPGHRSKIIGFRVSENSADLILEILETLTQQDQETFISINHLFQAKG